MVHLSEKAVKQLSFLKKEDSSFKEALLRLNVKKGGCSGLSYKMDFTQEIYPNDQIFGKTDSVRVVIDSKSLLYIAGMTLDYEGGLNGKGFIFKNPNAKDSCGCGSSFAV